MHRTRLTIATLSIAASAMVLGIPAATATSMPHQPGNGQAKVAADDHADDPTADNQAADNQAVDNNQVANNQAADNQAATKKSKHHSHHRREHRRLRVRRHHTLRWHHRCGPGWDSGWVRGSDRDRFRDRDRFDRRKGDRDRRNENFRDDGDRGWGRGWISSCDWRRGEHHERRETSYAVPKGAVPMGAVRAGEGGSVNSLSAPELAAGGSLAALGLAGAVGAMRRRSSSH